MYLKGVSLIVIFSLPFFLVSFLLKKIALKRRKNQIKREKNSCNYIGCHELFDLDMDVFLLELYLQQKNTPFLQFELTKMPTIWHECYFGNIYCVSIKLYDDLKKKMEKRTRNQTYHYIYHIHYISISIIIF